MSIGQVALRMPESASCGTGVAWSGIPFKTTGHSREGESRQLISPWVAEWIRLRGNDGASERPYPQLTPVPVDQAAGSALIETGLQSPIAGGSVRCRRVDTT